MKKVIIALLTIALLSTGVVYAASINGNFKGYPIVNVNLNGAKVTSDVPAVVLDGRTLLPTRAIAEALNCVVLWDAPTMTANIIKPTVNMIYILDYTVESDDSWNLINVGGFDIIGKDKMANFYVEVGSMDRQVCEFRTVAYDPKGNVIGTSVPDSAVIDNNGLMIIDSIENLTFSIPGNYTFRFQIKYNGEYQSVGETKVIVQ